MKNSKQLIAALLCLALWILPFPAHAAESEPIRIAFVDSGVSLKHLDAAQVEPGENFVFPDRDTDDRIGHGTATAGIVLGSASLGLPALCPQAVIVPLVCYDTYPSGVSARGDGHVMAQAIRSAVDLYHCRIINISMGMTQDDPELRAAVGYALAQGAILVSAVGNDNRTAPERVYYPAAYDGVIGVGAADGTAPADFSQRHGVDVLAQGVNLPTATNRNSAKPQLRSGTSFSCAYVSGLCAAIWASEPELSADAVRDRLCSSAKDIGEVGFDADSGWGIVTAQPSDAEAGGEALSPAGDVPTDAYYCEAVRWAMEKSIVRGVGGELFAPDLPCTRAQLVTFLWRAAGSPSGARAGDFTDISADSYYAEAVAWAVESGITVGTGNGLFRPDAACTRAQAVTLLYRANGSPTVSGSTAFSDVAADAYYASAVMWAAENSISSGVGSGSFGSDNDCTRAQLVTLLWRCMK